MRFGWASHRDEFHDLVGYVNEDAENHLANLILLMDFMIPLVCLIQISALTCFTYFSTTFVGAGLFLSYPVRDI